MATVKVNQAEWDGLTSAEQTAIVAELKQAGLMREDTVLVADGGVPPLDLPPGTNPAKSDRDYWECILDCEDAKATGIEWCRQEMSGSQEQLERCYAGVHITYIKCKRKCKELDG